MIRWYECVDLEEVAVRIKIAIATSSEEGHIQVAICFRYALPIDQVGDRLQKDKHHPPLINAHLNSEECFSKYGSWEALDGCKVLLCAVRMIYRPGNHNFKNCPNCTKSTSVHNFPQPCRRAPLSQVARSSAWLEAVFG